jgi:hypothetical protein
VSAAIALSGNVSSSAYVISSPMVTLVPAVSTAEVAVMVLETDGD